jgi:hypothetical protein
VIDNVVFETPLDTREHIDAVRKNGVKAEGVLLAPFIISFDWDGGRWRLEVPVDYAAAPSVPPFLRSFAPATGGLRWGSFAHDWVREKNAMPLKDGDNLLIGCMKASGDGWYKRAKVWAAVRVHAQFKETAPPTYLGMSRV